MEQGQVAGAAMAGQNAAYEGTVPSNTLKVVGIDLMAVGDIDAEGQLPSLVSQDEAQKTYRKLVIKDNIPVGAILLGDLTGSKDIQQAIRDQKDLSSLKTDLEAMGFDLSSLRR